ncbi:MAG: allantoinase [Acidimicrobiales bacterium]|jgi:allantoinase
MPADGTVGMDHDQYEWSPIPTRTPFAWPGGEPLALGAMVLLEHYEWQPPEDAYTLRSASGGLIKLPDPDYLRLTHREYGHRVGIFRLLDTLERHAVPPTVAIDVLTAEHYPWLVNHCVERGCEIVAHGIAASRMITSKMSEEEEVDTIARSLDTIESSTGSRPRGWFGPEGSESTRTPSLLAAAGVDYLCDWPNDEQPYAMTVPTGELTSLPLYLEVDDEQTLWTRRMRLADWRDVMVESASGLHADGVTSARHLMLTLRPWLSGQPFRVPVLDAALADITAIGPVWKATGSQIVDGFRAATPLS